MAVRRRRGGRGKTTILEWIRGRLMGIVFVMLAGFFLAAAATLVNAIPESYIWVDENGIGAGPTPPESRHATAIGTSALISILFWFVGILVFVIGLRKLIGTLPI